MRWVADFLFFVPLSVEFLDLLLVFAGMLLIIGGLFPKARAWAGALLLFVVVYLFSDPLVEAFGDIVPSWVLWGVMLGLLMNVGCETLVILGYFRDEQLGWFRKPKETRPDRRRKCFTRIVTGVATLPFRLAWRMLAALFKP